ncbi:MAG: MBL fold metallo-hydrolase [Bacteroidetes bacterium]|nr:MBL fold metallo-hydrolase [Bacteroidota bacterium]
MGNKGSDLIKSWKTTNGYLIYRVLSGRCNVYLIVADGKRILVDTSTSKDYSTLQEQLLSSCFPGKGLDFLILTHTHYDHCQNAQRLKQDTGCRIYVSEAARQSVANGYTRLPSGTTWLTKFWIMLGRLIGKSRFGYNPFVPEKYLTGNYDFKEEGLKIRIITTPGHSADSVSILVDGEIALVGDAMFWIFRKSIYPPFADDITEMVKSWGLLLQTTCKWFLPGHGRPVARELLEKENCRHKK